MQATLKKVNLHFVRMTELEKEIQKLQRRIQELESKLEKVETIVEDIERDIYLDEEIEENEETINCPYCDYEVPIYYDENIKELECPECHNTIELDWNGDIDDEGSACGGHCSSCGGCGNDSEEK